MHGEWPKEERGDFPHKIEYLDHLGKPLGSMNLEELLKSLWAVEEVQSTGMDIERWSPASSPQRQASLNLARAKREPTLGEITLNDIFLKAGDFVVDSSFENVMVPDKALTPQNFTPRLGLSPSTSVDGLLDHTPVPDRKRGPVDFEKAKTKDQE
ncbi:hypothetical protein Leryth_000592 [Lithospermum erythrorhizon]|nr:hypothetical protein Leryth_000592 [Lithospermum erythrorhizon]